MPCAVALDKSLRISVSKLPLRSMQSMTMITYHIVHSIPVIGGLCCRCRQEPAHFCQHGDQDTAAVSDAACTRSRFPRAVGAHSPSASGSLHLTLLCQQQLAACAAIMAMHHVVTGYIWVRILQVLHVVYLSFCVVSSSLQHVLLSWSCIILSQNPSDRVLCLCCLFVSPNSCCWNKAVLKTSLYSIS